MSVPVQENPAEFPVQPVTLASDTQLPVELSKLMQQYSELPWSPGVAALQTRDGLP